MAGAQREANGPRPAGSDAASAKWRRPLSVLLLCGSLFVLIAKSHSEETPPREDAPTRTASEPQEAAGALPSEDTPVPAISSDPEQTDGQAPPASARSRRPPSKPTAATPLASPETVRARLPKHVRSDTGRLANTRLHGDSKIDTAAASPPPDERAVVPIPARQIEEAGVRLFQRVRVRFWRGFGRLAEVGWPDRRSIDPAPASTTDPPEQDTEQRVAPARTTAAQAQPVATAAQGLATPAPSSAPTPSAPGAIPAPPVKPELVTLEADVFDRIRGEIKARLPYFQRCVDAARRRGLPDIRRLQATWLISEDGSIKDLRLEGVSDELLATCIMRMGSRPFPVSPGTELTIPTPIVFVR